MSDKYEDVVRMEFREMRKEDPALLRKLNLSFAEYGGLDINESSWMVGTVVGGFLNWRSPKIFVSDLKYVDLIKKLAERCNRRLPGFTFEIEQYT